MGIWTWWWYWNNKSSY